MASPTPQIQSASLQRMMERADALRASMPENEEERPTSGQSRPAKRMSTCPGGKNASMCGTRGSSAPSAGMRKFSSMDGAGGASDAAQMVSDYEVVRHRYEEVLKENENLKVEQQRRMESYMRREGNFQTQIGDLKSEIDRQASSKPPADARMKKLRDEHKKVMSAIASMQSREQGALQEQEKDLLRAFRARLWDVQFELENERSKKDDGAL
eukprot:6494282-Prymnesium_polylepis.1